MTQFSKTEIAWLRKSLNPAHYKFKYVHVNLFAGLPYAGSIDGFKLHALPVDMPSGAYVLGDDGTLTPNEDGYEEVSWTIVVPMVWKGFIQVNKRSLKWLNEAAVEIGCSQAILVDKDTNSYVNHRDYWAATNYVGPCFMRIPTGPHRPVRFDYLESGALAVVMPIVV